MDFTLREENGKRWYDSNGISLPSVTTITGVANSYAGIRKDVLEDASDIGIQVHNIIARLIQGDYIFEWYYLDKRIRNGVSAYDRLRQQLHYKPRRAETIVHNLEDGYAGTEDSDGDIPDGHILMEYKTGEILPIHYFQIAAYYAAHLKTFKRERLRGACLVHLDKETGRPHPHFLSTAELNEYYPPFMGLKILYEQTEILRGKEETWKLQ